MAKINPPSPVRTPQAEKAQSLIGDYNAKAQEIRDNKRYTPEGKREAIDALYRDTKNEVDALRQQLTAGKAERVKSLRQQLFGNKAMNSSDAISLRDAQERVSTLDEPGKALTLLDQAELVGDTVMAKAVLQKAIDEKWSAIAHKYVEYHPAQEKDLEDYWTLAAGGISASALSDTMAFYLPPPAR